MLNNKEPIAFTMIQRFDHPIHKTILHFTHKEVFHEMTVTEAALNRKLIKKLRPEDALIIGYIMAIEQAPYKTVQHIKNKSRSPQK